MTEKVRLHESWLRELGPEFGKPYMQSLRDYLRRRRAEGATIYPASKNWFAALDSTPFDQVKVVILGQDPYHGPEQAHGLCFSVKPGIRPPPSLVNIFKELHSDVGMPIPRHGYLQAWAERGVLLLNTVLTVEQGQAGSHQGRGWETFTDAVIAALDRDREGLVFMLWGSHAQKKGASLDQNRHLVLKAPHPSPLSAHRGFLGCRHFSKANAYLGQRAIDWSLPEQV